MFKIYFVALMAVMFVSGCGKSAAGSGATSSPGNGPNIEAKVSRFIANNSADFRCSPIISGLNQVMNSQMAETYKVIQYEQMLEQGRKMGCAAE